MSINNDEIRRELRDIDREHNESIKPTMDMIDRLYQEEADSQTKWDVIANGVNRTKLVKVGGVAILTSAFLAACGGDDEETAADGTTTTAAATATADAGDVKALQFAASVENLAVDVYTKGAALITDKTNLALATLFMSHHKDHAAAFNAAIKSFNGTPVTTPNAAYAAALQPAIAGLKTEADVLKFALQLELQAASTYFAQQGNLKDLKLGTTLMSIGGTEYRHAALLSAALKMPIESTKGGFITDKEQLAPK